MIEKLTILSQELDSYALNIAENTKIAKASVAEARNIIIVLKSETDQLSSVKEVLKKDVEALKKEIKVQKDNLVNARGNIINEVEKQKKEFGRIVDQENTRLDKANTELAASLETLAQNAKEVKKSEALAQEKYNMLVNEQKEAKKIADKYEAKLVELNKKNADIGLIDERNKELSAQIKQNDAILEEMRNTEEGNIKVSDWLNDEKKALDLRVEELNVRESGLKESEKKSREIRKVLDGKVGIMDKRESDVVERETKADDREKDLNDKDINLQDLHKKLNQASAKIKGNK